MFRYADTGKLSAPGELQRKVVTRVRKVTYINNHPNPKVTAPIVSEGYETVLEEVVSPEFQAGQPRIEELKQVDGRQESQIRRPVRDERRNEIEEKAE